MSDNFEHDKPYSLTATYLANAEPSQLTASYDLHATFTGVPEGGLPVTQYLNTFGFLATEFATPKLQFTQFTFVVGFTAFSISSPKIYNSTQSISVLGLYSSVFGTTSLKNKNVAITALGFNASSYGRPTLFNLRQYVRHQGFYAGSFGTPLLKNKNTTLYGSGFNASSYGRPTTYNLRQYVRHGGFHTALFGKSYFQGGVKYVTVNGFNVSALPSPRLINTRADQTVRLTGIGAPGLANPNVSPRILYARGFLSPIFGQGRVYNLHQYVRAVGFDTSLYGVPWASHSPRYISPFKVDGYASGYGRVFDRTQFIRHADSPKIPGGIFGDISVRNTRRIIQVAGFDPVGYGDWSNVYSNLTQLHIPTFGDAEFGNQYIWNKTPSVVPQSFDSLAFGDTFISERVRRILGRGFGGSESQRFGKHTLTKPPELNPHGFLSFAAGQPVVSNKTRYVFAGASDNLRMGSGAVVWFRYRYVNLASMGIYAQVFSNPKIEHGIRYLLTQGSNFIAVGRPTVWFRVRSLAAVGIDNIFATNHRVGGTQFVKPYGYVTSLFGERIVPENQAVYGIGFNTQGFSETNRIELHTRWVRATGFLTFGVQTSDRYGRAHVWNKRQYINHSYDSGDGLNPGSFGQWTAIANRNRTMLINGFNASRHGYTKIDNNARPLLISGEIHSSIGAAMITDRVRYVKPETMESPYLSSWGRIFNTAFVIAPVSAKYDQWGHASVVNTRREYRWVGAFESMVFGNPMVAFRIRKLSVESRYSIAPIYMPLPKVDLYTRYIETLGSDSSAFGGSSLHIKWNILTPRWTHREWFGEPHIWNVTPELKQRGNRTEEFGNADVKLYTRYIPMDGYGSLLMGRVNISYRNRSVSVAGRNYMGLGLHKVVKTGAPPYSLQAITLDWAGEDARPDDYEGLGIRPPQPTQFGSPNLKTNVVFATGFVATRFGSHHTQSNGILLESGIQEFAIGNHFIGLKNRTISVPTMGDLLQMRETRPRLSPHTIYAVVESPGQARNNHPYQNIHYVNSDVGSRQPGEVFGNLRVTLRHRKIYLGGFNQSSIPQPTVMLKRRYIRVTGFSTFRMGWHFALDGSPQDVEQYESRNMQAFGRPYLVSPYYGPQTIRVGGINASSFGTSRVEHFHRTIRTSGSSMMIMGASRGGDTAYKPQSLWVGRPMPTIPAGFNAEKFGNTTIGLRVRDVGVFGFDAFNAESDISNFKGRLKVIQVKQPQVIEPKEIYPQSFGHTAYGVPDIRLKVHYIRPDGNSNQFRKGGSI